ncbi:hypothetical protein STENM223S_06383 [Streptomyces tendae]
MDLQHGTPGRQAEVHGRHRRHLRDAQFPSRDPDRLVLRKYDAVAGQHVLFREER